MPHVGIRVADSPAPVAALRRALIEDAADGALDDAGFETRFAAWWDEEADRRLCWLAYDDDQPVGLLAVTLIGPLPSPGEHTERRGWLTDLAVLPDRRRQGIGGHLLDFVIADLRRRGVHSLVVVPSDGTVPLLSRAGFGLAGDHLLTLPLTQHAPTT